MNIRYRVDLTTSSARNPRRCSMAASTRHARCDEILVPHERLKLFEGPRGKSLSNMAMLTVIRRMNGADADRWVDSAYDPPRGIVPHGFRASFRTWAEEATGFPHAVVEEAMGHQIGKKAERSYRRTDVLDRRRELMNAWGAYCEPPTAGNVVRIRAAE
jgi:integrase